MSSPPSLPPPRLHVMMTIPWRAADTKVTESLNSLSQQMKERVQVGHNDETADAIPTATEKEAAGL